MMNIGWMNPDSVCNGYQMKFDPLCSECYAEDFFIVFFLKHAEISAVFYFTSLTYASLNGILCTVKGRLL